MSSLVRGNLLTQDLQSIEGATTAWSNDSNATGVGADNVRFYDGAQCLSATSVAAGTMKIHTPQIPCNRASVFKVEGWSQAATTGRSINFYFDLWNSGVYVTTPTSPSFTNTTGSWTYCSWTLTLPNATTSQFTHFTYGWQVNSVAITEKHSFDRHIVTLLNASYHFSPVGNGVLW